MGRAPALPLLAAGGLCLPRFAMRLVTRVLLGARRLWLPAHAVPVMVGARDLGSWEPAQVLIPGVLPEEQCPGLGW